MADTGADASEREARASIEELKEWRVEALRLAERAEEKAEEVRLQSEMYTTAASELEKRAFKAEALAKESEAKEDEEGAEEQHKICREFRTMAEKNYKIADDKGREAVVHEREVFDQRSLAARLKAQIVEKSGREPPPPDPSNPGVLHHPNVPS